MKSKLKIIDAICEFHPSAGVDIGWSEYTGGMKDTGSWFVRKMLDVPLEKLESFLLKLNKEKEESKKFRQKPFSFEDEQRNVLNMSVEFERRLLFGK